MEFLGGVFSTSFERKYLTKGSFVCFQMIDLGIWATHWQSRASCELVCWKKLEYFGLQRIKLGFKALFR